MGLITGNVDPIDLLAEDGEAMYTENTDNIWIEQLIDFSRTTPLDVYVCRSDRKIICHLDGITKFDIQAKLNDISEISFEVQRYVLNPFTFVTEENISYKYLHAFTSLYIPSLGQYAYFRIDKEPV
jgi:hypothetical protein